MSAVEVASSEVAVERSDGVLAITLDRPHRLNAVTTQVVLDVVAALESAIGDPAVRVVTLTGRGRAFCAGADISGPASEAEPDALPDASTIDAVNRLAITMRAVPQLVVALVNGPAVGVGSSFALGCDLALASDAAYLKTGFEAIGLMPDGGGTAYLVRALGRNRAMATSVLGDPVRADEALRTGLFARVWPADEFATESAALVRTLAQGPTRAHTALKGAVNRISMSDLPAALEYEREHQRLLLMSQDHREGVEAFQEKRTPNFSGR